MIMPAHRVFAPGGMKQIFFLVFFFKNRYLRQICSFCACFPFFSDYPHVCTPAD